MKTDRLISILLMLLERRRVSARELADSFEISLRTVYRDMESLMMAGIPVTSVPGTNGGYEIMPQFKADKKTFSAADISVLLTGLSALSDTLGKEELMRARLKLNSLVPPEQTGDIQKRTDRFLFGRLPWTGFPSDRALEETLRSALDDSRLLSFEYVSTKGELTARTVEPYKLMLKGGNLYLYGYCTAKKDFRTFRVSRMRNLCKGAAFVPRDAPEPQTEFNGILESLRQDILLKVGPSALDRVLDFCPFDRVTETDGGYLVRFPFIPNDYYYGILMSFGDACECLEPECIRSELKAHIRRLASVYSEPFPENG